MPSVNSAERLERIPVNKMHYRLLGIHGMGWMFDAMDVGIITFVLAALSVSWNLNPGQLGLIGSAGPLGMFVGAAASGWLADRYGRKAVFQTTLLIFSIATLLNAFAWNLESMLFFRFLVGLGLGGELPVVSTLMSEFVPTKARGRFVVLLESFWALGWLAAALVAFFVIPQYGWQAAFLIGALPAFYVWFVRRKLPESPRWLESQGRLKEAEEIMRSLEDESSRNIGKSLLNVPRTATPEPEKPMGLRELWSGEYFRRTLMLWITWFCLVFGYYGIFTWLPTLLVKAGFTITKSFGYVLIITLAQVPGYFSAAWLVERWGRRPTLAAYLALTAVMAYFYGQSADINSILVFGALMSFFNLGAWGAIYAYTPELYPTRGRASGAGFAASFGRIGGVIAPSAVGILLVGIGTSGVFAMNAVMLAIAGAAVLVLGPETKGLKLEQIAR
ncbi:Putative sialic acid transporter [Candidatus Burarchaeum australiense]|nr:Putative sialic acid transporter [Candidatus Burarchaeum australiense]